jgi:TolA-binding protein
MRKWLEELVDQYLEAIANLEDTPVGYAEAARWADWMKSQWAAHGLNTLKQQRNLMTEVRNAVKQQLGEDHMALESMNFTKAEWTQINDPIDQQVATRNENQGLIDNPDAIVQKATALLSSREWADVAAALAVLTGRRSSEILATARFYYKTPYSVTFTGALKRRGEQQTLSFEIPTLAPAQMVIEALNKLHGWVDTKAMSAEAINQRYAEAVARACDRNFCDLVPLRSGRDNLYTHLFRTIYARIATHWYAPPNVADIEFMAAIQGHYQVLDEQNPELKRSLVSSRHYNDYKIGDSKGNIDGRQGIKLSTPGVSVIEIFANQPQKGLDINMGVDVTDRAIVSTSVTEPIVMDEQQMAVTTETEPVIEQPIKQPHSTLRCHRDERERWMSVLDLVCPDCPNQLDKMSTLLQWTENHLTGADSLEDGSTSSGKQAIEVISAPAMPAQESELLPTKSAITDLATGIAFLTKEIEAARTSIIQLEQERQQLVAQLDVSQQQLKQFQRDNEQLRGEVTQLQQSQTQLQPLLQLLQGVQQTQAAISPTPVTTAINQPTSSTKASVSPDNGIVSTVPQPQTRAQKEPKSSNQNYFTEAKVNRIIDAIIAYNDSPERTHAQKWTISIPIVKDLGKQIGATYQAAIQRVFTQREQEIAAHHAQHGLGKYHNRGKQGNITQFIHL